MGLLLLLALGQVLKMTEHRAAPVTLISAAVRGKQGGGRDVPNTLCDVPHYTVADTLCALDVLGVLQR